VTLAEDRDPTPPPPPVLELELPRFCACGRPHPCYRCWPDKTPPWAELYEPRLPLEFD
jgi:hypothetical protein